jgi:type I restriction enzyme, S subunit
MSNENNGLVPKLRFPEFRDAGGWKEKELSKVCQINPSANALPETFVYIDLESVEKGRLLQKRMISKDGAPSRAQRLLASGDLIFQMVRPYQKNNYFFMPDDDLDYVASTGYAQLRAYGSHQFLFQYLHHDNFVERVLNKCTGSNYPAINSSDLSTISVELPALPEQQKIADCLSSLDALIRAQADKVDALKTHKKALMQQLFPHEGETVPRLRFPQFKDDGEWAEYPLSEFVSALDAGVSVNSGDKPASATEFGILKTSCVTKGIFEPLENKVVFESEEIKRLKEPVSKNTIIISRMNTPALVGANAYIDSDFGNYYLPDRLWAAKPTSKGSMRFVAYILGSDKGRKALSELATGSSDSMKNISKPAVLALKFLFPDENEQQKIADCLSSLDELITAEADKLDALKTHKKGLMQQLFPALDEVVL